MKRQVSYLGERALESGEPPRVKVPGTALPMIRVLVQVVSKAHRSDCARCGQRPAVLRWLLLQGSGRGQRRFVFCVACGQRWAQHVALRWRAVMDAVDAFLQ